MGLVSWLKGAWKTASDVVRKGVKSGAKLASDVFKAGKKAAGKAADIAGKVVTTVYNDGKKAVQWAGGQATKTLDFVRSPFTMILLGVGGLVALMALSKT